MFSIPTYFPGEGHIFPGQNNLFFFGRRQDGNIKTSSKKLNKDAALARRPYRSPTILAIKHLPTRITHQGHNKGVQDIVAKNFALKSRQ